jgi:hypothetical protein
LQAENKRIHDSYQLLLCDWDGSKYKKREEATGVATGNHIDSKCTRGVNAKQKSDNEYIFR